jgi:hypothetical protein
MSANKVITYLREAPLRCSSLGKAPGLTHKHYTRLITLARDKYSSLFQIFVNYGQSIFIALAPAVEMLDRNKNANA